MEGIQLEGSLLSHLLFHLLESTHLSWPLHCTLTLILVLVHWRKRRGEREKEGERQGEKGSRRNRMGIGKGRCKERKDKRRRKGKGEGGCKLMWRFCEEGRALCYPLMTWSVSLCHPVLAAVLEEKSICTLATAQYQEEPLSHPPLSWLGMIQWNSNAIPAGLSLTPALFLPSQERSPGVKWSEICSEPFYIIISEARLSSAVPQISYLWLWTWLWAAGFLPSLIKEKKK